LNFLKLKRNGKIGIRAHSARPAPAHGFGLLAQPTTKVALPAQPCGALSGRRRWRGLRCLAVVRRPTRSPPQARVTLVENARQGAATGGSPEQLGSLEARRSSNAVGFWGCSGSSANDSDFLVVLQWSGPGRDVTERLNQNKTHLRVALIRRGRRWR
jgi:hypothetical protein